MKIYIFILFVSVVGVKLVTCAKILFFTLVPALSHQKVYQEVWRELSLRGHDVYAVTPNPKFNKTLSNLTEYDLSSMYEFQDLQIKPEYKEQFFKKPTFFGMIVRQLIYQYFGGLAFDFIYKHPEVIRLVKEHDQFDACVLEFFHPSLAVYGHVFKCPVIAISSNGLPIQMLDSVGNPSHPLSAPEQDLPISRNKVTFLERAWSLAWTVFVRIHHNCFIVPSEDRRIKSIFGENVPFLGTLIRNISLIILNRNTAFHRPVPNLPNVIELGAVKYTKPVQQVNSDLKSFLDSSKEGVVYFSLGISMSGSSMPPKLVKKIQSVFERLPFKFLWKWENATMSAKPRNVFISKYVPQVYVLEHPNVKLFITQGGLQSMEETIAAHKPIIGIPFHSDQTTNVDTCVSYGMGKMLDLEEITEEKLRSYILEIMNDSSYSENAKKLDELMKDQPQDGLEKAVWWIEYVIRHKGAKHLRSIAVDLPWWKYLMLDIIGFILAIIVVTMLVFYLTLKFVLKLLFKLFRRSESNTKRKDD